MVRTGATFADAAAEYLRYVTEDRGRKHSTIEDYRSIIRLHLLPAFRRDGVGADRRHRGGGIPGAAGATGAGAPLPRAVRTAGVVKSAAPPASA